VYEIAEPVRQWIADGHDPMIAAVVATRGFSSRSPGSAAAWVAGRAPAGQLLDGVSIEALPGPGLVDVTVSDADAAAAGLACGGTATVLVQPASSLPAAVWQRLAAREPLCLVTTVWGDAPTTELLTPATIRAAAAPGDDAIPRLFARGVPATAVLDGEPRRAVLALWPVPTLVVVGDGLIAAALHDTATLLGWTTHVTAAVADAVEAVGARHGCDAVVVLSHDRAVDGPALEAALAGGAGYVGALGSRRTQAARAEWLTAAGVPADAQQRIHGPAGLDIDAHTPAEIAISIVAEILAARAGSSGGALTARPGPVHTAGVQAPPPRY
jgi:xanthine dehydrogenase accessory factor